MIADDRFVRIGSANFSRRSMGVDSECDLSVDAGTDDQHRAGVRHIRDRLVGEHLGMDPDDVAAAVARLGSLRALIDARAGEDRTLLPVDTSKHVDPPGEIVKAAADPERPIGADLAADVATGIVEMMPPLDPWGDRGARRPWRPMTIAGALRATLRSVGHAAFEAAASVVRR
jgi:hypothetical protein